jgi:hypothetical protein
MLRSFDLVSAFSGTTDGRDQLSIQRGPSKRISTRIELVRCRNLLRIAEMFFQICRNSLNGESNYIWSVQKQIRIAIILNVNSSRRSQSSAVGPSWQHRSSILCCIEFQFG